MRCWSRALLVRVGTTIIYCYGVVLAPTLHHAFHHPDHIHVGDSIVYLPEHDQTHDEHDEHDEHDHDEDHDPGHHDRDDDHDDAGETHHHHHDDADHGGSSLWHFGAALSDHIDRTPILVATAVVVPLCRIQRPHAYPLLARRTLRLRGPPRECVA